MRVMTYNLNGMRSAAKKGVSTAFANIDADVCALQETRAPIALLDTFATDLGYAHSRHVCAEKPGYSGVSLLCKTPPDEWLEGCGIDWIDLEGRVVGARFGELWILSIYFPSGSSGEPRQLFKYRLLDAITPWLEKLRKRGKREVIVCGDVNIAHGKGDIANWRGNAKSSGFQPVERGWLSYLTGQLGWVDTWRSRDQAEHEYTWWSRRGNALANNVGWRIDYQLATAGLAERLGDMAIYRDEYYSDHAPYWVDYRLD